MSNNHSIKGLRRLAFSFAAFIGAITVGGASAWSQNGPAIRPPDASSPQSIVPAPKVNGQADTPGGSASNGIIQPPAMGGSTPVIAPPAQGTMPVIPPVGTPRNNPSVVPK